MASPQQRLRLAAFVVADLTLAIAGGTYLITVLTEAAKVSGWFVVAWAVLVAVGVLTAEYVVIRLGWRRRR